MLLGAWQVLLAVGHRSCHRALRPGAFAQARLKNPGVDSLWLAAIRMELRADRKKEADALMAKALQVRAALESCTPSPTAFS